MASQWLHSRVDTVLTQMEAVVHFPILRTFGCCRPEIENAAASTYDWSRLGVQKSTEKPEESDLLVVSGWISPLIAEELKTVYKSMTGRRSVIAVGACTLSGGPYARG